MELEGFRDHIGHIGVIIRMVEKMEATMDIGIWRVMFGVGCQSNVAFFHTCFVVEQALFLFGIGRVSS